MKWLNQLFFAFVSCQYIQYDIPDCAGTVIRNMRKTAKRKMVSTLKETSKGLKNTKELIINQNEQGWLRKIETKLRNLNVFQNTSSKFHVAAGF